MKNTLNAVATTTPVFSSTILYSYLPKTLGKNVSTSLFEIENLGFSE